MAEGTPAGASMSKSDATEGTLEVKGTLGSSNVRIYVKQDLCLRLVRQDSEDSFELTNRFTELY